jgi:hypothetical protein
MVIFFSTLNGEYTHHKVVEPANDVLKATDLIKLKPTDPQMKAKLLAEKISKRK